MGVETRSGLTHFWGNPTVRRTASAAALAVLFVATGAAVAVLPPHLPRAILLGAAVALVFTFIALVVRDLIRSLLIAIILLGTLQNVPLIFTAADARAGGAPDGVLILPADLAVAAAAFALLAYLALRPRSKSRSVGLLPGLTAGLMFCFWGALSTLWSFAPTLSISEAVRDAVTFATWLLVAIFLLNEPGLVRTICAGFVLATIGESVLALSEWFTGGTLGLTYLGVTEVERDFTNQALIRVGGTLGHPNFLGGYFAMSLPMVGLGVVLFKRRWQRLLAASALLLGVAALVVTASRGAYVAVAVEAGLAGILMVRAGRIRVSATSVVSALALIGGAAVIYVSVGSFAAYRIAENDPTTQYRWVLIQTALSIFWSHPLLGIGLNTFAEFLNTHYVYAASTLPQATPVHNVFLLIAAEVGIVGLTLFVAWVGLPIFAAIHRWRILSATNLVILTGCGIAVVGALLIAMIDWSMRSPALQLSFAVILACITAVSVSAKSARADELTR